MNRKRSIMLILLCVLMLIVCGCGKNGDSEGVNGEADGKKEIQLIFGSGHPAGAMHYTTAMRDFFVPELTKRIAERTDYTLNAVEAYGGAIAGLSEVFDAVEDGTIDIGGTCCVFEPVKLALQNFTMHVPFNSPDPVMQIGVIREVCEEYPIIIEDIENYNQKFLAWGMGGDYNLITKFPIEKMSDMQGKKIAHGGASLPFVENTGAIGVQAELNDAYTCLETGIQDGWIMFPASIYGFKLHEVAPHYTVLNFGAPILGVLTVNMDTWKDLPAEIQDIILEVSEEYEIVCATEVAELDQSYLDKMVAEGTIVNELSKEVIEDWAAVIPNLPGEKAQFVNEMGLPGSEVFNAYFDKLEEAGYKLPRRYELP